MMPAQDVLGDERDGFVYIVLVEGRGMGVGLGHSGKSSISEMNEDDSDEPDASCYELLMT